MAAGYWEEKTTDVYRRPMRVANAKSVLPAASKKPTRAIRPSWFFSGTWNSPRMSTNSSKQVIEVYRAAHQGPQNRLVVDPVDQHKKYPEGGFEIISSEIFDIASLEAIDFYPRC